MIDYLHFFVEKNKKILNKKKSSVYNKFGGKLYMKSEEKSINLFKIMSIFIFSFALFIIANSAKAATYGHYTYEYINNNKEVEITKYDGTAAVNIQIPSSINGKPVTSIGDSAFRNCSGLKGNLVIPNSVTSIGSHAFSDCKGLTGNIEEILKKLVNENKITEIPAGIFDGCSGLTGNLVIPSGVTSIGSFAFDGCSGLIGNLVMPLIV